MMFRLSLEYFILIFLAVTGVLQIVAMRSHLDNMRFFQNNIFGYIFAVITIFPGLFLFFTWNYRYETGVIQGAEQAELFLLGMAVSVVFTLGISSLVNHSRTVLPSVLKEGLDALKDVTYYKALSRRLSRRSQ